MRRERSAVSDNLSTGFQLWSTRWPATKPPAANHLLWWRRPPWKRQVPIADATELAERARIALLGT